MAVKSKEVAGSWVAPFSILIGLIVTVVTASLFNWSVSGILGAALVGSLTGILLWAKLSTNAIPLPKIDKVEVAAADQYWRAFVTANEGLGQRSLTADAAADQLARDRLSKSGFQPEGPVFQRGQSAANYWAKFDQEALKTTHSTPGESFQPIANNQFRLKSSKQNTEAGSILFEQVNEANRFQDYNELPPHLALIREATATRAALSQASKKYGGELGQSLSAMIASIDAIVSGLKDDPIKQFEVQRLFTYYLPQVGILLRARENMLAIGELPRVAEIDAIVMRLKSAFAQFPLRMHEADIRALDIDLKLLDQSLVSEFETVILP